MKTLVEVKQANRSLFNNAWDIVRASRAAGNPITFAVALAQARESGATIANEPAEASSSQKVNKRVTNRIDNTPLHVNDIGCDELNKVLVKGMKKGIVKFSYYNDKGRVITTAGTLMSSLIPTKKRKIEGKKVTNVPDAVIFYDSRHGMYRTYLIDKLINISRQAIYM